MEAPNNEGQLPAQPHDETRLSRHRTSSTSKVRNGSNVESRLDRRTLLKLDFILLPFLSILFLLNSLDKSNIGSAETAGFTRDVGISPSALNRSVACFFGVFVSCQPIGAALGRRFGMARYVPVCMSLWGLCTAAHALVQKEWQLIVLRVLVGALEAGFYPTTVSYLSLFYTRFEFAKRLGLFYGQAALAGALGGLLSWAVFRHFPDSAPAPDFPPREMIVQSHGWKSWQVLFVIEGCTTVLVALIGLFWLPHSADTAWFLSNDERDWAEERVRRDLVNVHSAPKFQATNLPTTDDQDATDGEEFVSQNNDEEALLDAFSPASNYLGRKMSTVSAISVTTDTGLTRTDILSAVSDWKIWYLLLCNILSAIPVSAFSVFLPLVVKGLASSSGGKDLAPAKVNLLTVPPFLAGACVLWVFTAWSDSRRERFIPILYGLAILLGGLTATIMLPHTSYGPRYVGLFVLLSGSFIPSPLTVAWLTNNTPEPGKRAIVLGINGWGNLAGVISALLFAPKFANDGYVIPFYVTLACVLVSFVGYMAFRALLVLENCRRDGVIRDWSVEKLEREAQLGDVNVSNHWSWSSLVLRGEWLRDWFELDRHRRGDERFTFRYTL